MLAPLVLSAVARRDMWNRTGQEPAHVDEADLGGHTTTQRARGLRRIADDAESDTEQPVGGADDDGYTTVEAGSGTRAGADACARTGTDARTGAATRTCAGPRACTGSRTCATRAA